MKYKFLSFKKAKMIVSQNHDMLNLRCLHGYENLKILAFLIHSF